MHVVERATQEAFADGLEAQRHVGDVEVVARLARSRVGKMPFGEDRGDLLGHGFGGIDQSDPIADHLAQLRPALPVLFMSGYTNDEIIRRGLANVPAAKTNRAPAGIDKPGTRGIVDLHLLAAQPLCVCVIKQCIRIADSKLSYHLSILKETGFIEGQTRKNWIIYRLTDSGRACVEDSK